MPGPAALYALSLTAMPEESKAKAINVLSFVRSIASNLHFANTVGRNHFCSGSTKLTARFDGMRSRVAQINPRKNNFKMRQAVTEALHENQYSSTLKKWLSPYDDAIPKRRGDIHECTNRQRRHETP
jgi:hypothetical protein